MNQPLDNGQKDMLNDYLYCKRIFKYFFKLYKYKYLVHIQRHLNIFLIFI